jgi:hypothetical protein
MVSPNYLTIGIGNILSRAIIPDAKVLIACLSRIKFKIKLRFLIENAR